MSFEIRAGRLLSPNFWEMYHVASGLGTLLVATKVLPVAEAEVGIAFVGSGLGERILSVVRQVAPLHIRMSLRVLIFFDAVTDASWYD